MGVRDRCVCAFEACVIDIDRYLIMARRLSGDYGYGYGYGGGSAATRTMVPRNG